MIFIFSVFCLLFRKPTSHHLRPRPIKSLLSFTLSLPACPQASGSLGAADFSFLSFFLFVCLINLNPCIYYMCVDVLNKWSKTWKGCSVFLLLFCILYFIYKLFLIHWQIIFLKKHRVDDGRDILSLGSYIIKCFKARDYPTHSFSAWVWFIAVSTPAQ